MQNLLAIIVYSIVITVSVFFSLSKWHFEHHMRRWSSHRFLAARLEIDGKTKESRKYYEAALKEAKILKDLDICAESSNDLADYFRNRKEFDQAESLYRDVIVLDSSSGSRLLLEQARAYLGLSVISSSMGRPSSAKNFSDKADLILQESKTSLAKAILKRSKIALSDTRFDPPSLSDDDNQSNLFDPKEFIWNDQLGNRWLTKSNRTAGRWKTMLKMLVARENTLFKGDYSRTIRLARDLIDLALFDDAERILKDKLDLGKGKIKPVFRLLLFDVMAQAQFAQSKFGQAEKSINEAINLIKEGVLPQTKPFLELQKAQIFGVTKRASSGARNCLQIIQSDRALLGESIWYAYRVLGRCQLKLGKSDLAVKSFGDALKFARLDKTTDDFILFNLYLSSGEAKVIQGDIQSAKKDYLAAFEKQQSREGMKKRTVYKNTSKLARVYSRAHKYRAAAYLLEWSVEERIKVFGLTKSNRLYLNRLYSRLDVTYKILGELDRAKHWKDKIK